MASDLYDRILRVERRLRAIDLDSLSHRQRANASSLSRLAIWGIANGDHGDDGGCTGDIDIICNVAGAEVTVTYPSGGERTLVVPPDKILHLKNLRGGEGTGLHLDATATGYDPASVGTEDIVCDTTSTFFLNLTSPSPCAALGYDPATTLPLTDSALGAVTLARNAPGSKFWSACVDHVISYTNCIGGTNTQAVALHYQWDCSTKRLTVSCQTSQCSGIPGPVALVPGGTCAAPLSGGLGTGNSQFSGIMSGTTSPLNLTMSATVARNQNDLSGGPGAVSMFYPDGATVTWTLTQ